MSAWTNIKIPDRFDRQKELEFKIKSLEADKSYLYDHLENIFDAAVKYKEIEITSADGKNTIKLRLVENEQEK